MPIEIRKVGLHERDFRIWNFSSHN